MKIYKKILIFSLPALLLAFAVLGLSFLRTDRFQELMRTTLIEQLTKATGMNCRIGRIRLNVFRGKFEVDGIELASPKGASQSAIIKVAKIRGAASLSSFWNFRLHLAELDIDNPEVRLVSGAGESSWNPDELLKNLKISLQLKAERVSVHHGWFQINNIGRSFDLSLNNLNCEIRYAKKLPSYRISIMYEQSRLFYEQRDMAHRLEARLNLSLEGIEIESFTLTRSDSHLTGAGRIGPWKTPALVLHAAGTLNLKDLRLADSSLNEGRGGIDVAADMRVDGAGIHAKGQFSIRAGWYRKMAFNNLSSVFEIERDVLRLSDLSCKIASGSIQGSADIQLKEANKASNSAKLSVKNVPLLEAGKLLNLPLLHFENGVDSTINIVWRHDPDLKVDCNAYMHGLEKPSAQSGKSTLLQGNALFSYYGTGALLIESANLSSPHTTIQAAGGKDSWFHIQLATSRLAEPLGLIAGFSPPVKDLIEKYPDVPEMPGAYKLDGDVRIMSSSDVDYQGGISIKDGAWRSYKADTLSAQARLSGSRLSLQSLAIRSGQQEVKGNINLELAEDGQASSFLFEGGASRISLESLQNLAAKVKITGALSGSGKVAYERGKWEGTGQFAIENGSFGEENFSRLQVQASIRNQLLHIVRAEAARGEAHANASGKMDLDTGQFDLAVRLRNLSLGDIPAIRKKDLPVHGRMSASGVFKGNKEHPSFEGTFELAGLRYDSWDLGHGTGKLQLQDDTVLANAKIQSEFGNFSIQANASTSKGYPGKAALEFEKLDVQKIVPGKVPSFLAELSTDIKGRIQSEGNLEDLAALTFHGEMDGASFKIHDYGLQNSGQIRFTIANNGLRVESVRIVGEGTSLNLSGTIPLDGSPRFDLGLSGKLNLRLFEGIEKKLRPSGTVSLNIRTSGMLKNPQIIGRASFEEAKLDYSELPLHLSTVKGDVVFSRNLVKLENVHGTAASGAFQVSGQIEHQDAIVRSIYIAISAQNVRLLFPKDFRSVVNAELVLNGNSDFQALSGDVEVVRAEYIRNFNLMEQLASRSVVQTGPLTAEPLLLGLRLNVEIHSDNGLLIDNELTKLRGSMRLSLLGTPAYPYLSGHVEAGEGTIFFRGSRFEISHAAADFTDRNRINPTVEIRAEADVKTYRLILDANGSLDNLNINVTSDPPMSTVDILSLLTTGKTEKAETSRGQSEMASVSAASVLSESLTGVIGKRVQRIFGLESFRVDPFLAGAENDPTARITISERISKDLVVTFSRNLTTSQEQIAVIEYNIGKSVSIVATRDEDGKFGLDFRFRKRFR